MIQELSDLLAILNVLSAMSNRRGYPLVKRHMQEDMQRVLKLKIDLEQGYVEIPYDELTVIKNRVAESAMVILAPLEYNKLYNK